MGLWGGFDPDTLDLEAIKADMLPALMEWFSAHVVIYDPSRASSSHNPNYDPFRDNKAADPKAIPAECVVWDSGPAGALVQPQRRSAVRAYGGGGETLSSVTVQTSMGPDIALQSGLRVAVLDGGNASNLEDYVFAVREGFDGSLSWGQIITCDVVV